VIREFCQGFFDIPLWKKKIEEFDSALCRYRLFRTSRLVVQTAGSNALASRVDFDLEIICSTIFDSSLRNWEWHKRKKDRYPHLNLNLLLPKPVDA
jgi:hypothetical protein